MRVSKIRQDSRVKVSELEYAIHTALEEKLKTMKDVSWLEAVEALSHCTSRWAEMGHTEELKRKEDNARRRADREAKRVGS